MVEMTDTELTIDDVSIGDEVTIDPKNESDQFTAIVKQVNKYPNSISVREIELDYYGKLVVLQLQYSDKPNHAKMTKYHEDTGGVEDEKIDVLFEVVE